MRRFNKDPKRVPLFTKMQHLMRLDNVSERIHHFTIRFWRKQSDYQVTLMPEHEGMKAVHWERGNELFSNRYRRRLWLTQYRPYTVFLEIECKLTAPRGKMVYAITDKHI